MECTESKATEEDCKILEKNYFSRYEGKVYRNTDVTLGTSGRKIWTRTGAGVTTTAFLIAVHGSMDTGCSIRAKLKILKY